MKQANNQGVDNLAIRLMYLVGSEDFFSFPPRSANCQLFLPVFALSYDRQVRTTAASDSDSDNISRSRRSGGQPG